MFPSEGRLTYDETTRLLVHPEFTVYYYGMYLEDMYSFKWSV